MKKNIAVLMLAVLFSWTSVDAASVCSYEKQKEISKSAANVKITYEEAKAELDPSTYSYPEGADPETYVAYYEYFKIKILNITEDIYLKLENSSNEEVKYIEYKDTDEGTFTIAWENLEDVTTFSYTIYSSTKTGCPDEEFRKGVMTTPKLNEFYTSELCVDIPDYYLCQKYITTNVSSSKFVELAKAENKKNKKEEIIEKEKKDKEKETKNIKNIFFVVTSIIIVGGGIAIVIVSKKRRSRIL